VNAFQNVGSGQWVGGGRAQRALSQVLIYKVTELSSFRGLFRRRHTKSFGRPCLCFRIVHWRSGLAAGCRCVCACECVCTWVCVRVIVCWTTASKIKPENSASGEVYSILKKITLPHVHLWQCMVRVWYRGKRWWWRWRWTSRRPAVWEDEIRDKTMH